MKNILHDFFYILKYLKKNFFQISNKKNKFLRKIPNFHLHENNISIIFSFDIEI